MELTGEQRALRDAVRAMLARYQRRAAAAGDGPRYDPALWQRLCGEIGVAGLAVPEEYGGAGAGPAETHVAAEELGTGLTPSPLLGSAVLATQALLASGDSAACQRLLPPVAAGTAVAALAWTPEAGHWDPGEVACQAVPPASPGGGWATARCDPPNEPASSPAATIASDAFMSAPILLAISKAERGLLRQPLLAKALRQRKFTWSTS